MREYKQGSKREKRPAKPLNSERLRELALNYVARFATSSGKLDRYLQRKLYERGWEDEAQADQNQLVENLVRDFSQCGYIDDDAYARARSSDLLRRGYGGRRVGEALRHAGIGEGIRQDVAPDEAQARHAALRLAQKRRFGPFGLDLPDSDKRQKQLAAMLRAGHSIDHARAVIQADQQIDALEWAAEYDGLEEDDPYA